jgi:GMP synthase (glutamine-hydrolysing)
MIYLVDNTIDGQGASPRELRGALELIRPDVPIVVEHFKQVSRQRLQDLSPSHIILSGQSHPWELYSPESLVGVFEVIRHAPQPILGVCGGHQQIALAFGAPVGLIRRIAPGEGYEGAFRERGFFPVELNTEAVDAAKPRIFDGLPSTIIVWHSHCEEIKSLPAGFRRTAGGQACAIQAMQHGSRPLFGVQFHPELFDEEHPQGRQILENFLKL